MRPSRALLFVLPGWLLGWAIALALPDTVVAGDPPVYLDRMQAIEAGGIPYVDPVFEHLPAMLVPMYAARVLSGFGGEFAYTVVFSLLMVAALAATAVVVDRSSVGSGTRFLLLAGPLVPLVVFRNDPAVVLAAVIGVAGHSAATRRWAGVAAVLAKGWPIATLPVAWRRGERATAVWWSATAAVAAGIMLTPGFRSSQAASGLHAETLGGGVFGLIRSIQGGDLGVEWTTAVYLDVPLVAFALGPMVASAIAVRVFWRRGGSAPPEWALAMALTAAVMLSSPLFSSQYVLWILPFLALDPMRRWTAMALAMALLSLVPVLWFDSQFAPAVWWWAVVCLRNVVLVALAWKVSGVAQEPASAGR